MLKYIQPRRVTASLPPPKTKTWILRYERLLLLF